MAGRAGPCETAARPPDTSSWATARPDTTTSLGGAGGGAARDSAPAVSAARHEPAADAQTSSATHMSSSTASSSTASSSTVPASYVPAPVAFVSGDDNNDYQSADGTGYAAEGPVASAGISGAGGGAT